MKLDWTDAIGYFAFGLVIAGGLAMAVWCSVWIGYFLGLSFPPVGAR